MKTKTLYTAEEISEICKVSKRTIERRRKSILANNPECDWFRMGAKPYRYNYKMLGEFLNPELFELIENNRQLSNTIECMHRTETLEQHLSFAQWDYFITISYKEGMSKQRCFSAIEEFYERLAVYCFDTHLRLFFTTEPFTNRSGHHNHIILRFEGTKKDLQGFIKRFLPIGIVDVQPYDNQKAGVFYICKEGLEGEDWYLNGNRLSEDGTEILRNKNRKR